MDISVILPVQNQADHIEPVLRQYLHALHNLNASCEVLVVINGPRRDDTLRVCQSLSRQLPDVRVLVIEQAGWGRAVRWGLSHARGDLLCYTNSARTAAKDLVLLLTCALANADCVIKANRRIRASIWRRLASLTYNLECRVLFDLSHGDVNGTPKVFPRKFSKLLALSRDDDLIDLQFSIACRRENYRVLEVPILSSSVRHSGSSTTNWRSAIRMYSGAIRLWREGKVA